jgi:DNA-binding NarL/FixJ family response regulator
LISTASDAAASEDLRLLLVPTARQLGGRVAALLAALEGVECMVSKRSGKAHLEREVRKNDADALIVVLADLDDAQVEYLEGLSRDLPMVPLVVASDRIDDELALRLVRIGVQECLDSAAFEDGRAKATLHRVVERHRLVRRQHERETRRAVSVAASGILDRLPLGVMMIDGRGQVLMTNAKARAIIAAGDGVMVDPANGGFRAENAEETKALLDLVKRTIAGEVGADESCALTISRPSMRHPICLMVTPLAARSRGSSEARAGAAIFLSDPDDQVDIDEDVLRGLYELTRVEARLALGLVRGQQLDELATETKVSVHTVRSQLKQVFRKTDTNRQADLVKLLLTGPAAIRVQLESDATPSP